MVMVVVDGGDGDGQNDKVDGIDVRIWKIVKRMMMSMMLLLVVMVVVIVMVMMMVMMMKITRMRMRMMSCMMVICYDMI